jgi:dihydroorotate dehydrogenase (NAD+) catalytic subunit
MLAGMGRTTSTERVDLSVSLGRLTLRNPMVMASGTCGYGLEYAPYTDLSALGAFTTKSVTVEERPGNPPPRIVETACGLINAIGLANVGLERFVAEKVPDLPKLGCPVFVNVAGHSIDDYVTVCGRLDGLDAIAGLELNVSCPNVADGLTFGTDADRLGALVAAVRAAVRRCLLIVKLSPNVTDITATARAAIEAGADCLSLVNTFVGMAIDRETWRPVLANTTGGVSGPAIKPLALHLVHRVYVEVARPAGVPVIGMGGVQNWADAVDFHLAGATAVAVGSYLYVDPDAPRKIAAGVARYLADRELSSVQDLIGQLRAGSARRADYDTAG